MKRYEWKLINKTLGYWGYWDNVKHEFLIETTTFGKRAYEEFGFKDQ